MGNKQWSPVLKCNFLLTHPLSLCGPLCSGQTGHNSHASYRALSLEHKHVVLGHLSPADCGVIQLAFPVNQLCSSHCLSFALVSSDLFTLHCVEDWDVSAFLWARFTVTSLPVASSESCFFWLLGTWKTCVLENMFLTMRTGNRDRAVAASLSCSVYYVNVLVWF